MKSVATETFPNDRPVVRDGAAGGSLRCRVSAIACLPAFVAAFAAVGGVVRADTLRVPGGGHLTGPTKTVQAGQADFVVVKVDDAMQVAIPSGGVKFLSRSKNLQEYRQRVIAAGENPEAHYQLARWCKANRLTPQRNYHMRRTIDLAPDHAEARGAMGYQRWKGGWISVNALRRSEGLVRADGGWRVPEAVAMSRAAEDAERESKLWIREFARLRKMASRGNPEAVAEIKAIEDPLAAEAIARELQATRPGAVGRRETRLLWVEMLARFRNATSVEALTLAGLDDPDPVVREAAIEALREYGKTSAVGFYVSMLKSKQNSSVRAAARALLNFPDPELRFTYVNALKTDHSKVITVGGGTGAGFSNDGGGGLSSGSKKVKKSIILKNPEVLALLREIAPEVNYGYDTERWRLYFAEQLDSYDGPIARDR